MTTLYVIPCTPDGQARWTQRTTLSGRDYVLTFDWNQRDGSWSLALADQDGDPIASGVKLVVDRSLLSRVHDEHRPPGSLYLLDTQDLAGSPGFDDLGTRFVLVYGVT